MTITIYGWSTSSRMSHLPTYSPATPQSPAGVLDSSGPYGLDGPENGLRRTNPPSLVLGTGKNDCSRYHQLVAMSAMALRKAGQDKSE